MKDGANELHKNADIPPESIIDIDVSNDGPWSSNLHLNRHVKINE